MARTRSGGTDGARRAGGPLGCRDMRRAVPAALAALALTTVAAGCGEDVEPVSGNDVPAVTAPGTTIPFEDGGGDGSGSDGRVDEADTGGIAGGRDAGTP